MKFSSRVKGYRVKIRKHNNRWAHFGIGYEVFVYDPKDVGIDYLGEGTFTYLGALWKGWRTAYSHATKRDRGSRVIKEFKL